MAGTMRPGRAKGPCTAGAVDILDDTVYIGPVPYIDGDGGTWRMLIDGYDLAFEKYDSALGWVQAGGFSIIFD